MGRFLKVIGGIIGLLIILVIIAAVILALFVDPNVYKNEIQQYVKDQTGRKLVIKGNLHLSYFPWLGIQIPNATLGNPSYIKGPNLAKIGTLNIKIQTLPLIIGHVKIKELDIKNAKINLITNKNGQTNWSSWAKPTGKTPKQPMPTKTVVLKENKDKPSQNQIKPTKQTHGLSINTLKISDSAIHIINNKTKTTWRFDHTNLNINNFSEGKVFPVRLSFKFSQTGSLNTIQTNIISKAKINPKTSNIQFPNLKMQAVIRRPVLPKLPIHFQGKLQFNPHLQTLDLSNSSLEVANASFANTLHAENLFNVPAFYINSSTKNTQIGPFLSVVYGKRFASGLFDFTMKLNSTGASRNQIMANLKGSGNLKITKGTLEGIDIGHLLNQAVAYINKKSQPSQADSTNQTRFQSITASYTLNQGKLYNQDFRMVSGDFFTTGKGVIDLANQRWNNYELSTRYRHKEKGYDFTLPIILSGPLSSPNIVPDFKAIAKSYIKNQIQHYLDKNVKDLDKKLKGFFNR